MASRAAECNEEDFLSAAFERRRNKTQSRGALYISHIGAGGALHSSVRSFHGVLQSFVESVTNLLPRLLKFRGYLYMFLFHSWIFMYVLQPSSVCTWMIFRFFNKVLHFVFDLICVFSLAMPFSPGYKLCWGWILSCPRALRQRYGSVLGFPVFVSAEVTDTVWNSLALYLKIFGIRLMDDTHDASSWFTFCLNKPHLQVRCERLTLLNLFLQAYCLYYIYFYIPWFSISSVIVKTREQKWWNIF